MPRVLLWDWTVRGFHWVFAIGFVSAMTLALVGEGDGRLFPLHMLIGLLLAAALVLRVTWGIIGTRHARVGSFLRSPTEVGRYLARLFAPSPGEDDRARNPASAYAVLLMGLLLTVIVVTGVMMARGNEAGEDLHGAAAWGLVGVAAIHVIGVSLHSLRRRDGTALSMITGHQRVHESLAIPSARPALAVVMLALLAGFAMLLYRDYDQVRHQARVPLTGITLNLGDDDSEHHRIERRPHHRDHD